MSKAIKSQKVPSPMQEIFNELISLIDSFCKEYLNEEYAELTRYAAAALCRKNPSPIRGQLNSWACGIIHALGVVNFLQDKSSEPYISSKDLYKAFNISESTGQAKSKKIRETLKIRQFDHTWCLPSRLDSSLYWRVSVDGFIVDARSLPVDLQVAAYNKGLIPYVPLLKDLSTEDVKN